MKPPRLPPRIGPFGGARKARAPERVLPLRAREHAEPMAVVHAFDRAVGAAQHHREVLVEHRGARHRRMGPDQVAQGAAVLSVLAAAFHAGRVGLADAVRQHDDGTARLQVLMRGRDRRGEVVLGEQVHDRIVDHDRVERPPEPHGAHVALDMLGLGIEGAADLEHVRREVDQRHPGVLLQVRGIVAAARPQFQDGGGAVTEGLDQHLDDDVSLGLVFLVRRR